MYVFVGQTMVKEALYVVVHASNRPIRPAVAALRGDLVYYNALPSLRNTSHPSSERDGGPHLRNRGTESGDRGTEGARISDGGYPSSP
jgi:hypothetical protein